MSVVSLARKAGLTPVPANALRLTSFSRLEAEVSMMSTTSCLTIASIKSRNSARVLSRGVAPFVARAGPTAWRPGPMSGSFASAMMKSDAPIGAAADARELVVEPEHAFASAA